ncbi:glycosyltransferase family 61 protein [Paracoccus gahaiensis]|uniref:Glycosyltransferase family 61 protein n=1 Tax=Paracoccus gahaiensis TaxID=1706839 RepID=A0A4U0R8U7_9RHOB|nr:glycosyltransferase family 61 protein [Paracoccus gahaiensis]TJZ91407.1 glycosyltransferase family 61 protein [Paracoccus gahaiensis]
MRLQILDEDLRIDRPSPRIIARPSPGGPADAGLSKIMKVERQVHRRSLETFAGCHLMGEDFILKDGEIFNRYVATGAARTRQAADSFLAGRSAKLKIRPAEEGGAYHVARRHLLSAVDLDVRVLLGTSDEPVNYGMWLFIVIPAAHEFLTNRGSYDRFMCHCPRPWQRKILHVLGIGDDDLIEHDLEAVYRCASLTLHRASRRDLYVRESYRPALTWVAEKFGHPDSSPEKIFVSRLSRTKNGAYRGLANEGELAGALEKLGFRIVEPELLAFPAQVDLFRNASAVVGLGGAGMFNTLFCRDGTKVVDIESGLKFLDSHCNIFSSCKLDYAIILGEEDLDDPRPVQKRWTIDLAASMAAIEGFLEG